MVVDEVMLLAFVDGELEPGLRQQVESVVANSPSLRGQVEALRASCLPYRAAFDAQALPPLPAALAEHVASLVAVAGTAPAPTGRWPSTPVPRRAWITTGLAASFAAGAFLPRALGPLLQSAAVEVPHEPWIEAVARYHALYVRETVDRVADISDPLPPLLDGFDATVRQRLRVPDLAAQELVFRRAQRLGYGGAPLIQLVYLPRRGRPLAVCFLTMHGRRAQPHYETVANQNVATWHERGLAFVVVGDLTLQALRQVVPVIQAQVFA